MGRGGPPEPELVESPPDVDVARRAVALRPPRRLGPPRDRGRRRRATIGCRRAGGGLAGPAVRLQRAPTARASRPRARPDIVVFDGSGTAIPPVAADRRVLVVGPGHDLTRASTSTAGSISDLVVAVGCELRARSRPSFASGRSGRSRAASPCSPRARRRPAISRRTSSTSRRSLGDRDALRRELARARGRHLPDRAEGRRDRPRRRGRARARAAGRARRERRRRARARRGAARARPARRWAR